MPLTVNSSNESAAAAAEVHEVSAKGFNANSEIYERARPSYPPDAVAHLKTQLRLVPSESHVLDLAAGSGKLTRLLLPENYHLTAVEPSPSMRAVFSQILPNTPILDGTSSSIPVEDGSQDAVVVAQAFHWFANVKTLQEIHRVLKPNGRVGLIWNLEDRGSAKWVGKLRDLYEQYEMGTPQYRLEKWKDVWGTEKAGELFTPLQEAHFEHVQACSEEMVVGRVLSKSYIACLPHDVNASLKEQVLLVLRDAPDVQLDPETGFVRYPYKTNLFWCEKLVKHIETSGDH